MVNHVDLMDKAGTFAVIGGDLRVWTLLQYLKSQKRCNLYWRYNSKHKRNRKVRAAQAVYIFDVQWKLIALFPELEGRTITLPNPLSRDQRVGILRWKLECDQKYFESTEENGTVKERLITHQKAHFAGKAIRQIDMLFPGLPEYKPEED